MSISMIGMDAKLKRTFVKITVAPSDPLISLGNSLPWRDLANVVLPDLKKTEKGLWWTGRPLFLRIHLAILILQCLFKETDRGITNRILSTPVLQVFCGLSIVLKWFCPNHTKIMKFRNRLSGETMKLIGQCVIQKAVELGFANPTWMDVDSTVQEANMSYPSDASLMLKLANKCQKILDYMVVFGGKHWPKNLDIDLKSIKSKSMEYFFLAKNTAIEKKRELFQAYHQVVKKNLRGTIEACSSFPKNALEKLPWNIKQDLTLVGDLGWRYLLDVAHFIRTHSIKPGKTLAFHLSSVACIKKGKIGKENEFGRAFHVGRIGGNFLLPLPSTSVKMPDKKSLILAAEEHQKVFGADTLESIGADKGYYSAQNIRVIGSKNINTDGIQRPVNIKDQPPRSQTIGLRDRRAGIEPLIGHVKSFGLKRSTTKSDLTTLSSGYRSILGFNLHQLSNHLQGKAVGISEN